MFFKKKKKIEGTKNKSSLSLDSQEYNDRPKQN